MILRFSIPVRRDILQTTHFDTLTSQVRLTVLLTITVAGYMSLKQSAWVA